MEKKRRIYIRKRIIIIVSLIALNMGCASGPIGHLPTIKAPHAAGKVTVMRNRNIVGSANSYYITLDGQDIFKIRIGQYTDFKLNAGEYYIGLKCFGGWSPTWKNESLKLKVLPNSEYFFIVSPSGTCAEIEELDEKLAKSIIPNSKYVSMEQDKSGGNGESPNGN